MKRQFNYEVGDYVKYEGNLSKLAEILRTPDIGIIVDLGNDVIEERVYLYMLGKQQHIWCDYRDIKELGTEPEHLKAMGFDTIEKNGEGSLSFIRWLDNLWWGGQNTKDNLSFPVLHCRLFKRYFKF